MQTEYAFSFPYLGICSHEKKTRKVCFLFNFVLDFEGVLCLLEEKKSVSSSLKLNLVKLSYLYPVNLPGYNYCIVSFLYMFIKQVFKTFTRKKYV